MIEVNIENIVSKYSIEFIFLRITAYLIDVFLLVFFSLIISFIISLITKSFNPIIWIIAYLSHYIIYFVLIEGFSGYTLGKLILRIKVVDSYGEKPGILKSLIRNIIRLLELNPILFLGIIGLIIALTSGKKQRLGDMAASTYVVKYIDLFSCKDKFKNSLDISTYNLYNLNDNNINKPLSLFLVPLSILLSALIFLLPYFIYSNVNLNSQKENTFVTTKTYLSNDKSCKLSLPDGWEKKVPVNESILSITSDTNYSKIGLYKYNMNHFNNDLYNFCVNKLNLLKKSDRNMSNSEILNIVINNHEGYQFISYYTVNEQPYGSLFTVINVNTDIYLIEFVSLKQNFENNRTVFENISRTFELRNDKTNYPPNFEKKLSNARGTLID
jgi:uncharacterized RDD family membrane protein YckC